MLSKSVSIIIGTKNRQEYLEKLVDSIKAHTHDYEIIVVDDASKDQTPSWAIKQDFKYIRNNKSIPVADAWNQGAEAATGKYLVFLNDDMVVEPHWAEEQVKLYETNPHTGSLAFKVYDDEGNVQSRGHSFMGTAPYLPDENVVEVDYSDHPFVSKRMWRYVGGFTAYGHMYYEDSGFGLKLQSRGYKNYYNPKAVLRHLTVGLRTGSERDKKQRHYNENKLQLESKKYFFMEWEQYLLNKK